MTSKSVVQYRPLGSLPCVIENGPEDDSVQGEDRQSLGSFLEKDDPYTGSRDNGVLFYSYM